MTGDVAAEPARSATGARIIGDDLQFLIGWYWCLAMLQPNAGIQSVALEAASIGNLDDVVVTFQDGATIFHQVKGTVSAERLANSEWLLDRGKAKKSLLEKLYDAWFRHTSSADRVVLTTGRPGDPGDPILSLRDRHNKVGASLRRATAASETGSARSAWAEHLGISEEQLCSFLDVLEFELGQTEATSRDRVRDVASGVGVRFDDLAISAGLQTVREWVKDSRVERSANEVNAAVNRLGLRAEPQRQLVIVNALAYAPATPGAIELNWVAAFRGDGPETRRGTVEPEAWNARLTTELRGLVEELRGQNATRVLVRGHMRLPCWFAIGSHLREVAGFDIATTYRGSDVVWTAETGDCASRLLLTAPDGIFDAGPEIALVVNLSTDGTADANSYFHALRPDLPVFAVTAEGGPDRRFFRSPEHTAATALSTRQLARDLLRSGVTRLHLVLCATAPFALFLGHFWDRVPDVQLYEDLAPGYEPAFEIRNR